MRPLNNIERSERKPWRADPKRSASSKRRTLERRAQRRAKAWVQS